MSYKVILTVTQGILKGKKFVFDERTTCIIGRKEDCGIQLPNDEAHKKISRQHCLLDINPPDIRVKDFGSLNGTYINGVKIGKRQGSHNPEEAIHLFLEYDLKEGDEIRLGETVFCVGVSISAFCRECIVEIPDGHAAESQIAPGIYLCNSCQKETGKATFNGSVRRNLRICIKCHKDVSEEIGKYRLGEFLCASCRADPQQLVNNLLDSNSDKVNRLVIQGYKIIRELGRGGMGAVYLAYHTEIEKQVALKIMIPQVATDEYFREGFLREIENTKALNHPNVVQLQDCGFSNGMFFFTLEYCDCGSVEDLMEQRGGKLSISEASELILQILDGLEYAHQAYIPFVKLKDGGYGTGYGLVHRDIKPANLFLVQGENCLVAKVGDYGLAKAFDLAGFSGQTRTGTAAGSPWFMPRQQVSNFKYVKPEVDVWASAASFYNMVTGHFPREFPRGRDEWQVVLQSNPIPIRNRDASIPRRLAEVIDLALTDKPSIYFKTAAEFKRALKEAL